METRTSILLSLLLLSGMALVLLLMGRVPYCECGHITLWQGVVASPENSQQLSDWYTPSHFIHGILFLALFAFLFRRMSIGGIFLISTLIEVGWEILENSPVIINRYREVTISWGYVGDSVINSVSDVVVMWFGFFFARYVPWWVSLIVVIMLEVFVAYMIRDNLTLNILMLVYPMESVRLWQAGG